MTSLIPNTVFYKKAHDFFVELYLGEHHIPGQIRKHGSESYCVNHYGDASTYDFDLLTRLVFLAHDKCMRASIEQSGPNMIKIIVWKREGRTGKMFDRHPTIESALKDWRINHKEIL